MISPSENPTLIAVMIVSRIAPIAVPMANIETAGFAGSVGAGVLLVPLSRVVIGGGDVRARLAWPSCRRR
jgi:hypothetical protein